MIKVVGAPTDLKRVTCPGCGYKLEYRPNDVRTYHPDYDSGDLPSDRHKYITCPRSECQKHIKLDVNKNSYPFGEDDSGY